MQLTLKFPATPEYASKHAELIVPLARDVSRAVLDFTPGSVAKVDEIIEVTQGILGDLEQPHNGVLFVLPVSRALGLHGGQARARGARDR